MDEKTPPNPNLKEPQRGSYPISPLPDSLSFVTKVYNDLGYAHYHDKDTIAKIHGTTYHSIKQKLSTALQYGLLDLKYGTGYKITPLFLKLYRPQNEQERIEGVLESLQSPPLYKTLISEYNGNNMPSLVGLSTSLFRRHGLHESAATKAAQVFLNNLKEYGLVGDDNVLSFTEVMMDVVADNESRIFQSTEVQTAKALPPSLNAEIITSDYLEIPIPLKNGKAYLRVPDNATTEDFEKIAKIVAAYT